MNISEMRESKFLKKEDAGNGILVTVRGLEHVNVAKEGAEPEMKWAVHFDETEKPLIINGINSQLMAQIFGSEETDDWTGKKVVLDSDPTVSFGGKLVGGIRVRAPRGQAAKPVQSGSPTPTRQAPAPKPVAPPDEDGDSVPF